MPIRKARLQVCLPRLIVVLSICSLTVGCELFTDWVSPPRESMHAEYARALEVAGLADTPAVRRWTSSWSASIDEPEGGAFPHSESGWFDTDVPEAYAVRLADPSGGWIRIRARMIGPRPGRLFLDGLRLSTEPDEPDRLLASAADSVIDLRARLRGRGDLLVRMQPELGRGGAWEIQITHHEREPEITNEE